MNGCVGMDCLTPRRRREHVTQNGADAVPAGVITRYRRLALATRLRETALHDLRQEQDEVWLTLAEQRQIQQVFHTLEQSVTHEKQQQRGESEKDRQQVRQRLLRVNCAREPVPGPVADRVPRRP